MFKFKKQDNPEVEKSKIRKRVEKLSTQELMGWADQAIFGVGRAMSDWQRYKSKDSLSEAVMGAEALHEVLKLLKERTNNDI